MPRFLSQNSLIFNAFDWCQQRPIPTFANIYLKVVKQQECWQDERARETWEIEQLPEAKREEIRRRCRRKEFEGEILKTITADEEHWGEEMMREELVPKRELFLKSRVRIAEGLLTLG